MKLRLETMLFVILQVVAFAYVCNIFLLYQLVDYNYSGKSTNLWDGLVSGDLDIMMGWPRPFLNWIRRPPGDFRIYWENLGFSVVPFVFIVLSSTVDRGKHIAEMWLAFTAGLAALGGLRAAVWASTGFFQLFRRTPKTAPALATADARKE